MLYNNKVPMLTIHEKAKSEIGLWNSLINFSVLFDFRVQRY